MGRLFLLVGLGLVVFLVVIASFMFLGDSENNPELDNFSYSPSINPGDFVDSIDSDYYNLNNGNKFLYGGREYSRIYSGMEWHELIVTNQTKTILGVKTTLVLENKSFEKINDSYAYGYWYAQDKEGNLWLFSFDSNSSCCKSWEAGKGGRNPVIRLSPNATEPWVWEYQNESEYKFARIYNASTEIKTEAGTFTDCLSIEIYDPNFVKPKRTLLILTIEPAFDYEHYCPGTGLVKKNYYHPNARYMISGEMELVSIEKETTS